MTDSTEPDDSLFAANPFGHSVCLDDVVADLEFLDDWEDRYRYLIDLGKQLPTLAEDLRRDDHLVRGCQSQVWLYWQLATADSGQPELQLLVDSDAHIVRGLAALVLAACNRQSPATVAALDAEALFADLDLISHLSPTRGNGLRAMVSRIQSAAAEV